MGIALRMTYTLSHDWETPPRKLVQTWTRFKLYDDSMLYIYFIATSLYYFVVLKIEDEVKRRRVKEFY